MTVSDLLIFMKNKKVKKKKKKGTQHGWDENTEIYVNTGFTRGKSRSNLGPARWPLSISVNQSLAQSGCQWQPLDISILSSRAVAAIIPRAGTYSAEQIGVPHLEDGAQSNCCLFWSFHTPSPTHYLSTFMMGFPALGLNLKFLCNWQGVYCGNWGPELQAAQVPRD